MVRSRRSAMSLQKPSGAAVGDRAEQILVSGDAGDDVVIVGGLGFGEADPAVFGVGETSTGHHVVGGLPGRPQDGVPGRDAAFHSGGLDEHGMAVDPPGQACQGRDVLIGERMPRAGDR